MLRRSLLFLVILLALGASADEGSGKRWWSYVEYLASDRLEGRLTGSEGHRLAAEFVAQHFQQDGLKPAGTEGYIQPVKFYSRRIVEAESSLALVRGGQRESLEIGEDALISAASAPAPTVDAPLEFIGYGLSIPEMKYDDLAGRNLLGKVVVYLSGAPASIPGPLGSHAQSAEERWKALRRAGAIGTIGLYNPHHMDIPWTRIKLLRFQVAMELADPALEETSGKQIQLAFNPARAGKLFAGSGHTFEEMVQMAERGEPLPRFPLNARLEAHTKFEQHEVTSQNIVALFPGSDPALKNEYVALTAHVDHLGVGEPIHGDRIYHGALDNAAGVACLLEVANALHESGARPRRSLLFVVVTGEEKGLLGSKYFVAHPTVPLQQIVADINMDMYLPIFPLKRLIVQGLDESDLGQVLKNVASAQGIDVLPDPAPQRNAFIRSDQYSFVKQGIPAIKFNFGYLKGSPEETIEKEWLTNRYHAPADDLHQPVDLPAAAEYNKLVLRYALEVANRDARPQWNAHSFFRRYAK